MIRRLTDFATLAEVIEQTPNDYHAKTDTVNLIKHMKAMALEGDAVASYRLAKIYPENSAPYMKWMKKAADQGLTNAMLDLGITLAKTGSLPNLQQAANYLRQVLRSNDSFMKTEAHDFLSNHRVLAAEVSRQMSNKIGNSFAGFFAHNAVPVESKQPSLPESLAIK